jgi:pyruvate formate lyase activating enzyme
VELELAATEMTLTGRCREKVTWLVAAARFSVARLDATRRDRNQNGGVGLIAETVATRYWHLLDDGRVQCDVCPRACRLREGQRGLCFVRAREGGEVVLTTYGRSSGFCVDPIEKKPLNQFLPGTSVLSFGTAGCNLSCRFCQNWDISKSREADTLADAASPEEIAAAAEALGCASVAFTYNDPVVFLEYAIDVADACRREGSRRWR